MQHPGVLAREAARVRGIVGSDHSEPLLARAPRGADRIGHAKDIEDPSYTNLTLRITYKTRDGDRKFSHVLNLSLIP